MSLSGLILGVVLAVPAEIHRCVGADGTLTFQELPCPPGAEASTVSAEKMHFDAPAFEPRVDADGADTEPEPEAAPPDPGDDLLIWEEVVCHAVPIFGGRTHFPFARQRGSICHTQTRTATRRERCQQLGAYYESYRDSTITWSDRREELAATKDAMREVGCCHRYSRTSLSQARAPACVGGKAFRW